MASKSDDWAVASRNSWLRGRASDPFVKGLRDFGWEELQEIALTDKIKEQFLHLSL